MVWNLIFHLRDWRRDQPPFPPGMGEKERTGAYRVPVTPQSAYILHALYDLVAPRTYVSSLYNVAPKQ